MTIRIGSAGAPRWYDSSLTRLEEYVEQLVAWGATSTELVLHPGDADERTARVHVVEQDWLPVFERYRARGIVCHVHAPLHPRFKIDRWRDDRLGLQSDLMPVLDAVAEFAQRQGEACVLVVHGGSGEPAAAEESTAAFLNWAADELQRRDAGCLLAVELRRPRSVNDAGFDRSRHALSAFVDGLGIDCVGICWDFGHDWEGRRFDPAWRAQPELAFLRRVNHVHVHGAGGPDDAVHFPLQSGRVPWPDQVDALLRARFSGAMTLEVRYRFALAMGEPWNVLGESYALLRSALDGRGGTGADRDGGR